MGEIKIYTFNVLSVLIVLRCFI